MPRNKKNQNTNTENMNVTLQNTTEGAQNATGAQNTTEGAQNTTEGAQNTTEGAQNATGAQNTTEGAQNATEGAQKEEKPDYMALFKEALKKHEETMLSVAYYHGKLTKKQQEQAKALFTTYGWDKDKISRVTTISHLLKSPTESIFGDKIPLSYTMLAELKGKPEKDLQAFMDAQTEKILTVIDFRKRWKDYCEANGIKSKRQPRTGSGKKNPPVNTSEGSNSNASQGGNTSEGSNSNASQGGNTPKGSTKNNKPEKPLLDESNIASTLAEYHLKAVIQPEVKALEAWRESMKEAGETISDYAYYMLLETLKTAMKATVRKESYDCYASRLGQAQSASVKGYEQTRQRLAKKQEQEMKEAHEQCETLKAGKATPASGSKKRTRKSA